MQAQALGANRFETFDSRRREILCGLWRNEATKEVSNEASEEESQYSAISLLPLHANPAFPPIFIFFSLHLTVGISIRLKNIQNPTGRATAR